MRIQRLLDQPIITPALHPAIGDNIQGPSLVRVPDWVPGRLGRYYLYFADHKGRSIRMAYADALAGPWTVHGPGTLQLAQSRFLVAPPVVSAAQRAELAERWRAAGVVVAHDPMIDFATPHIASPDVHVDAGQRRVVMYFHGLEAAGVQSSRVALSADGIAFEALPDVITPHTYLRVFRHGGWHYGLAMPGQFYRSRDGLGGFEPGPLLFNRNMRHAAVRVRGDTLAVFWTQVGDAPERILASTVDLRGDWMAWRDSAPVEVLRPERPWEGADAPLAPSMRSTAYGHVNQLRDPAIFEDDGRTWLLYAVAGESGIAIADLLDDPEACAPASDAR